MSPLLALLVLPGCGYNLLTSERGLRPLGETVSWAGYVYRNPDAADEGALVDGTITVEGAGAEPIELTQLYADDYPGYWGGDVAPNLPVTLRIAGPELRPVVWQARTPGGDGIWFSGALFGMDAAWFADLLGGLGLRDAGGVAVWGAPADPDAWSCADIAAQGQPVRCFFLDEGGAVSEVEDGPITWFLATGLEPGEILVESGGASATYLAEDGELVLAFWFLGYP